MTLNQAYEDCEDVINGEFANEEEDEICLRAFRRFEQQGGNPLFRAEFKGLVGGILFGMG